MTGIKTANLVGSISRNAGGLYESVRRLVQSLQTTGMDVAVFSPEDQFTADDVGAWNPVKVKILRPTGPRNFAYSPEYYPALEAFAPDLVHTHGLWLYPSVVTNRYRRTRGIPYMISAHGMLDPWAIRNSRWKKVIAHFFYEGAHLRDATCLRALCESEARAIRLTGLKNPIAIVPNGIDLPEGGSRKAAAGSAPWQGLIEPGRKVMLFLSRIHPKKGLVNLIKAWSQNRQSAIGHRQSNEWVLAIAGWEQGGHEAELKQLCDELGVPWADLRETKSATGNRQPGILFLGPQFNAAKVACYQHCDGFILPSFSEGVPMVVLEAWAYGKPVLMTPECNLPAGFERGAAVRIETSVASIAQGLQQFFGATESERQRLGENGLALVRERFAWPKIGDNVAILYQWMLGGGTKPACVADF